MTAFFNRKGKGNFDENKSILSIYHGTDAYLLEDELNELQWHQIENRARENRMFYTDGIVSGFDTIVKPDKSGYYITSKDGKPLKAFINGYLLALGCNDQNNFNDKLFVPFPANNTGSAKKFVVYLESWVESLSSKDDIRKFGGVDTPLITNDLIDNRVKVETSRRLQLRWRLKTADITSGNLSTIKASKIDGTASTVSFQQVYTNQNDTWYANVGSVMLEDGSFKSDGQVYAVQLFNVDVPANTFEPALSMFTSVGSSKMKETTVFNSLNETYASKVYVETQLGDLRGGNGELNLVAISPDTTRWKITVDNDGSLITEKLTTTITPVAVPMTFDTGISNYVLGQTYNISISANRRDYFDTCGVKVGDKITRGNDTTTPFLTIIAINGYNLTVKAEQNFTDVSPATWDTETIYRISYLP